MGRVMNFDGIDDYIMIEDDKLLNIPEGDFTILFCINDKEGE